MTHHITSTNGAQEPQLALDRGGEGSSNIITGFFGPGQQPEDGTGKDTLEVLQRRINEIAARIESQQCSSTSDTHSVTDSWNATGHQYRRSRLRPRDTQPLTTEAGYKILRSGGRGPQLPNDDQEGQRLALPFHPLSPTGSTGAALALPQEQEAALCL